MMYKIYSDGVIEVITGPMFSGKTEELIKRIKTLDYAKVKTLVVKPTIDKRWDEKKIITRAGGSITAQVLEESAKIIEIVDKEDYDAICIDEVQFFDENILHTILKLAEKRKRVIVSGLDQDFEGKPFGIMPKLLAVADFVDKQRAVCMNCGRAATMTFRKGSSNKKQVVVGDTELYEARCRECHFLGEAQKIIEQTNEVKIK